MKKIENIRLVLRSPFQPPAGICLFRSCYILSFSFLKRARKLQRQTDRQTGRWILCITYVGLHPTGLQAQLQARRKKLESVTEVSVVQWMGELTRLKQGPRVTPHCLWQTMGRTWWQSSLLKERGDYGLQGINIRWLIIYRGNQQRGIPFTTPLMNNNHQLGLGQVVGKSVMCRVQVRQTAREHLQ